MNHPIEENLLGYVLGALDAQEQRDVQAAIDADPQLEERLLQIKNSLLPLDYLETAGPRPGLARRTCEMVASNHFDIERGSLAPSLSRPSYASVQTFSDDSLLSSLIKSTSSNDSVNRSKSGNLRRNLLNTSTWSLPDFAVAVALMAVLAGLLFPAISYSRYNSRIAFCQNNLRELGTALVGYSDCHNGRFPEIPSAGPLAISGSYAPLLKDAGFVQDDGLFGCPGATAECQDKPPVHIPSIEAMMSACPVRLIQLQSQVCGDYGFSMGYFSIEGYCPPQNRGRTNVVLVADSPSRKCSARISPNHGGGGQNCMFEDLHVQFVSGDSIGEDDIFVNDYNLVAPGCRPSDNVIAPGHLSPVR